MNWFSLAKAVTPDLRFDGALWVGGHVYEASFSLTQLLLLLHLCSILTSDQRTSASSGLTVSTWSMLLPTVFQWIFCFYSWRWYHIILISFQLLLGNTISIHSSFRITVNSSSSWLEEDYGECRGNVRRFPFNFVRVIRSVVDRERVGNSCASQMAVRVFLLL